MVETIGDALRFMENVLGVRAGETDRIDFFTAHEALHLGYEEAQTRRVPRRPGWFNLATHFPWAGLRTNHPAGAHIEYLRGIENPVGVKVGPGTTREQVARWLEALDPARAARPPDPDPPLRRRPHRRCACPRLIDAVRAEGGRVRVDLRPHARQHAYDRRAASRRAASRTSTAEVEQAFDIHRAMGAQAGRRAHRTDRRERHRMHRAAHAARAKPTWRGPTNRRSIRA